MANEFKVKKGLIVTGSGSTIFDVQGSQGQLFSVTDSLTGELFSVNDISGIPVMTVSSDDTINMGTYGDEAIRITGNSVSMGDSYIKRIETLDGKVKSSQQLLGEVTNVYSESVFVPEQKTVYNIPNTFGILFMPGMGYYMNFSQCDNVMVTSDEFLTITSPNGVESGTLTIDSNYGASPCNIWLVDDTNFYNFYTSSNWSNYAYATTYSKVIPSGNQTINFLEIDKPAINLGSGDTISVDGKTGLFAVTPFVDNDSGRFSLLRDSSYSTSFIDFTFEGWFEEGLVNTSGSVLTINFTYYGTVFYIDKVMNYWSAGQNSGNLTGIDFSTKIHIAATVSAISSVEAQVNLYINGVLLGSGVFYDYWGVGLPNMFGNPSYNIEPLFVSAKIHNVRIQPGIVYNANFTPPETLERSGATLFLFNGLINPITLSNIIWYNGIPINAESYTNKSIIQDSVQPIAFVNYSVFNGGITYPYVTESTYSPSSIGVPYTGLTNTYITPSLATYSVGDVIRYTPRDIKIVFESEDGLNSKTISFNTKTNIMNYEGIVTSLNYDSVKSNYVTIGSQIDSLLDNVILVGKGSTVNGNGVFIGNNVMSSGSGNVLVGTGTGTVGGSSVIVGALAYGGGVFSTSIGNASYANAYGVSIGGQSSSSSQYGVSLGYNAKNYSGSGVAIGPNQTVNSFYAGILIGSNSTSSNQSFAIGIGDGLNLNGSHTIGIGRANSTGGAYSLCISPYSSLANFESSQAFGPAYASANSSYLYAHKTNADFQFANQIVRFSYYISNQNFTGKRYISKTNEVSTSLQTSINYSVQGQSLLRGYTNSGVNGLMGVGVATIMIKASGTGLPNDWKIVEIRFLLRSLSTNSDYNFTIISTTTLASGTGSNHGFWTPSLEYSSNSLVFAIDKSTNNTFIGAVAHIEVRALNIS
jgi:hypothetical protein